MRRIRWLNARFSRCVSGANQRINGWSHCASEWPATNNEECCECGDKEEASPGATGARLHGFATIEKCGIANRLTWRKSGGEWAERRFTRITNLALGADQAASLADLVGEFSARSVGAAAARDAWATRFNCACVVEEPRARLGLLRFHRWRIAEQARIKRGGEKCPKTPKSPATTYLAEELPPQYFRRWRA